MTQYTVLGFYTDDDSLQVVGVIEGHHPVVGGDGGEWQPWATLVEAADPRAAEAIALADMMEVNGWEEEE